MRALVALLLLFASLPPVAAAACDPTGAVCVHDEAVSEGDCASGGFESGTTEARVQTDVAQASVTGSSYCAGPSGENGVTIVAGTPVQGASATWKEFYYEDPENGAFRQCFLYAPGIFLPCPSRASPPDPGWGTLLP